jgi:3'-5' exoribonuclease
VNKKVFVKDIVAPDAAVRDYFVVTGKQLSLTRTNKKYMTVTLRDRTGSIDGKVWDEEQAERLHNLFEKGDVVFVESRTSLFQGKPQLSVTGLRKVDEGLSAEERAAFYGSSVRPAEALTAEFHEVVAGIGNPYLRRLLESFAGRQDLFAKFTTYPASVNVHHVYIGGLIEHSLSVTGLGRAATQRIPGLNGDIVAAGGLLHDLGKIDEIEVRGGFTFSDRGRLLGHITLGVLLFEDLVRSVPGFPEELAKILTHIIVSHHGAEEWGSPRKPMCMEALTVHYLDNLDAKIAGVREHMDQNMEDERWTEYHRLYESRFYKVPEG